MRKTDLFAVAIWSAFGFGLIEGLALNATRGSPPSQRRTSSRPMSCGWRPS